MEETNPNVTEVTENVEETTEQTEVLIDGVQNNQEEQKGRFYTDEELDKMLSDRYNRGRRKAEKESRKKYGRLENVLKAGLGTDNINDATNKLSEFYEEQGINIPINADYDDDDIKILANKDAEDIISNGNNAVENELKRLTDLGTDKMSKREKAMFETLYNSHRNMRERKELEKIGINTEILDSKEFKEYEKKLNPSLTAKEKYEMYKTTLPKSKVETIGSMTNTNTDKSIKEHYTDEEISKLSLDDLSNPKVWDAVRKSMTKRG